MIKTLVRANQLISFYILIRFTRRPPAKANPQRDPAKIVRLPLPRPNVREADASGKTG
jgi:hypothetical protein